MSLASQAEEMEKLNREYIALTMQRQGIDQKLMLLTHIYDNTFYLEFYFDLCTS